MRKVGFLALLGRKGPQGDTDSSVFSKPVESGPLADIQPLKTVPMDVRVTSKSRVRRDRLLGRTVRLMRTIERAVKKKRSVAWVQPFKIELRLKQEELQRSFNITLPSDVDVAEKLAHKLHFED